MREGVMASVLQFPKNLVGRPTIEGATRREIYGVRLKLCFHRLLNRLGVPGAVKDITINDELTGQVIEVRVGVLFVCLSVNGRDYYFRRLTGKFDGTGYGCFSNQPSCCTPDRVQQSIRAP